MTDSDPGDIRITRNALGVVSDRLLSVDHEAQAAIEAVFVEAVYDASRRARLQGLGRAPVTKPSARAWDLLARARGPR